MKKYFILVTITLCRGLSFSYAQSYARWDSLMAQGKAYFQQKEYAKSNACYEQLISEIEPFDTKGLVPVIKAYAAFNYLNLGADALKIEDFQTSKAHFDKALAYAEARPDDEDIITTAWRWQGNWYRSKATTIRRDNKDLSEAVSLLLQAEDCFRKAKAPIKVLNCEVTRAEILINLAQNDEAEELLQKIISECGSDTACQETKGRSLYQLGKLEVSREQYQRAILHLEQSYELCSLVYPSYAKLAADVLNRLYTSQIPDKGKALRWKNIARQLDDGSLKIGLDIKTYAEAQNYILDEGSYTKGILMLNDLISQSEQNAYYPKERLAMYYRLRAYGFQSQKQYELSVRDYLQALSLLTESGEVGRSNIPDTWYMLSIPYYYWGKQKETMWAANNCIRTSTDYYGPWHSETMKAYSLRSNYAGFYNLRDTALNDRCKCFEIISHNIEQNFVYLTASERSAYWNKFLEETVIMFTFAHVLKEFQSEYTDELFNQQLMAKGLLLNAESSLQRAVQKNPDLNASYQKIRQLRLLAEAAETSLSEADAATLEADRMERNLGDAANSLYQSLNFLKINAGNIRAKLKPTELAIEFVDYRVGKDSVMYAALIMSPKWKHVRFLPLIEKRELESLSNVADPVWQPIMDIAPTGVTTVYFAPSGLLYQVPIESQRLKNGKLISDIYQLYRMSSTRWLAYKGDQTPGMDAVVYGGLKYNASVEDMTSDARTYARQREEQLATNNLRWSIDSLKYLPGTETEAKEIVEVINRAAVKGFHAEAFLGLRGTEASLKALDGMKKRVIHIATHGFYQEETSEDKADMNSALSRSGLYFAGADNTRFGADLPEDVDDGVLTAQEIAQLDFRGLDLVVLSACETGQGQISSDGVFGLQRGFKKAGANSILMSLWKVDDEATCLLMTEFYKNWTSGMSKHDALERAKQTVRSHTEKGWDAPKYWAAFILLDGIE